MKYSRYTLVSQCKALDKRLKQFRLSRSFSFLSEPPRYGWVKLIRGALGLSAQGLGRRMKISPQSILRMEEREINGSVTIESIQKAARAMKCRFVYAIVPDAEFDSYEAIVELQALQLAKRMVAEVSHSMSLENQRVDSATKREQVQRLALELKAKLDPRIWED